MEDNSKLLESDSISRVLNSDASLDILCTRLKQSITTGEEFSKFVKRKAQIEDDHYTQLKKFAGNTRLSIKTASSASKLKSDSFSARMDSIIEYDEKLFNVGSSYVKALNIMYDELFALIGTMARSRKMIKDDGKKKEKECSDAILAAEKAKQKYYHLCDDLEKLKASDPNKKSFSLKNKTVEQQEDELQRKVDLADQDYKLKVSTCKKLKDEILVVHRPTNSKKLKNLILELDIAMNVQLQKYATWNENLIMNSGVLVSPLKQEGVSHSKPSMKEIASSIDNEKDLYTYLIKYEKSPSTKMLQPVEYVVHPSLAKKVGNSNPKPFLNTKSTVQDYNGKLSTPNANAGGYANSSSTYGTAAGASSLGSSTLGSSNVGSSNLGSNNLGSNTLAGNHSNNTSASPPYPSNNSYPYNSLDPATGSSPEYNGGGVAPTSASPAQPTFGISIESLIVFAGIDNVPLVVKKCIDTLEAYGLNVEGIYRASGNVNAVTQLKESIDEKFTNYLLIGSNINPSNVLDTDVYTVASLLKLYFSSLPEPLLTSEYYQSFIDTVKSQDENYIAKKLHHLVFNLPDGAYFTLRALIFHLNKVAKHEEQNRMSIKNLSIIWGPAIMNDNSMSPQDLTYKSKVVEELMLIADEIFEAD
ncbi:RHO GTPase-activating protein Rgd1p [[Candida] railenensis]|uniref:RHO GTPase-activating protein Rgd1p n=1 Tax=[Candida] railenensis TaxID=45579 RepID=A0A9P0QPW6_9ASCO|nr:RHO GTPase-activating protein Rgd1p [[Candida] railenensis]